MTEFFNRIFSGDPLKFVKFGGPLKFVKFGFLIISYTWLVDQITIITLNPVWLAILIAFITEDFAGYWVHRLNHRVNIFWNRHIIHHSSEEFNLSCALRQSISNNIKFSATNSYINYFLNYLNLKIKVLIFLT